MSIISGVRIIFFVQCVINNKYIIIVLKHHSHMLVLQSVVILGYTVTFYKSLNHTNGYNCVGFRLYLMRFLVEQ